MTAREEKSVRFPASAGRRQWGRRAGREATGNMNTFTVIRLIFNTRNRGQFAVGIFRPVRWLASMGLFVENLWKRGWPREARG